MPRIKVGVTDLINHAAELLNLTPEEITTKSRTPEGVTARQAVAFVAHKRGIIRKVVAYDLGQREYSTIAHAQRQAKKRVEADPEFRGIIFALMWGRQAQLTLFQELRQAA